MNRNKVLFHLNSQDSATLRKKLGKALKEELEVFGQGGLRRKDANTLMRNPNFWLALGRSREEAEKRAGASATASH